MSAQAATVTNLPPVGTVESILKELVELSAESSHLEEDLIARGVPFNTIKVLVEYTQQGMTEEFNALCRTTLESASNRLGQDAVTNDFLLEQLERLAVVKQDMGHLRKIARGYEMDTRAINMLAKLVSANPGDKGEHVLNCLVDYGRCLGLNIAGLRLVATNDAPESTSVLPQIDLSESNHNPWIQYGTLLIEVLLGLAVTFTAISLLT